MDMVLNLIYTIIWTVEAVTIPRYGNEFYQNATKHVWRLIIGGFIILFTLMEIKKQVTSKRMFVSLCRTFVWETLSWFAQLQETWLGNSSTF